MAMTMRSSMASRVAGRRVAAKAFTAAVPRVGRVASAAPSFVEMAAPRLAARVSRGTVVVNAKKVSVGDLKKADLEGKRVFVRAGGLMGAVLGVDRSWIAGGLIPKVLTLMGFACRPERPHGQGRQRHR